MVTFKSLLALLGLLLIGVHFGNASTAEDQMRDLQLRLEQMFEEQGAQIKQLTVEMNQLRQTVERLSGIIVSVDQSMKIVENNHDIVMRNLTHVTDQSNEIMVNQQFCANHDRLRDLYFELLPKCEDPTVPPVTTQPPPTTPVDPNVYESCAVAPPISGVYNLVLRDNIVFQGYCEQTLVGGGWLVFQTRFDGSVDFNRSWAEYRDGFGDPSGEHWLGLKYLNQLTTLKSVHLLIDMEDYAFNNEFAYYSGFVVGPEQSYYLINSVGNLHGSAGDSFSALSGESFATFDYSDPNNGWAECAKTWASGYWYFGCSSPTGLNNLNGIYGLNHGERGIWWGSFGSGGVSFSPLKYVKMMIRYDKAPVK